MNALVVRPDRVNLISQQRVCETFERSFSLEGLIAAVESLRPHALVFVGEFVVNPVEFLGHLRRRDLTVKAAIIRSEGELCSSRMLTDEALVRAFWRFRCLVGKGDRSATRPRRQLFIDLRGREVSIAGRSFAFSPTEFRLLVLLLRYPGAVFSRRELVQRICSHTPAIDPRVINVMVHRIRIRIECDSSAPDLVQSAHGFGYLLNGDIDTFIDRITGKVFVSWPDYHGPLT